MDDGKDIPGFPDYKVFRDGSIVSYRKYTAGQKLKPVSNSKGALYVVLYDSKGNRSPTKLLSRIVAAAFVPNPSKLPNVVHKDSNKSNNAVDNLRWSDEQETHAIPFKNGKYKHYKITDERFAEIKKLKASGVTDVELAKRYKVNRATIRWWRFGKQYSKSIADTPAQSGGSDECL